MGADSPRAFWLTGLWYLAGLSRDFVRERSVRRVLFDEPLVFVRDRSGNLFAMADRCAHRAAPLSGGQVQARAGHDCIVCPYHGWAFDLITGQCREVPALSQQDPASPEKIRVKTYRLHEENGLVWLWFGPEHQDASSGPALDLPEDFCPCSVTIVEAAGLYQEAVTGLIDPAHTPYVHQQWWWRKGRAAREKTKTYETLPQGFRIPGHPPSGNSLVYRLLGGAPQTRIDFLLPGLRVETITAGNKIVTGLTAITPVTQSRNRITHCLYWNWPVLSLLKPVVSAMAASFLAQDGAILSAQALNQRSSSPAGQNSRPLFLGMPDMPAGWYMQLSRAWRAHMNENAKDDPAQGTKEIGATASAGFENPVKPASLHWRT